MYILAQMYCIQYNQPTTMENKKASNFILIIIAIILGTTLYKQFDFDTHQFENTGLAAIYIIVFVTCIVLIIKNIVNNRKKSNNKD